jgi:pimeloyl-ACP methyl ester carboxylesterase
MAAIKPTIVFIHGSWHNPNHFKAVRAIFEKDGFPTECPLQPTYNAKPAPPVLGLEDDVKVIQALLTKLLDDGKEVIAVLHSYGGVLGSEAIREEFDKKFRQEKGLPGGVLSLLYMCAFVIPIGTSLASALGGTLPPFIKISVRTI